MKNVVNHLKNFGVKSAFPIIDTFLINSYPNPIVTVMSLVSQPSEAQQDQDEVKLLYMFLDFHNATNVIAYTSTILSLSRSSARSRLRCCACSPTLTRRAAARTSGSSLAAPPLPRPSISILTNIGHF